MTGEDFESCSLKRHASSGLLSSHFSWSPGEVEATAQDREAWRERPSNVRSLGHLGLG